MAALIEGTGTTKAQSYKMSVERNAVLTGQNKSSLLVPSGELSLEEARDLLDSIIQELPLHAATLTEIKAEYEKKVESLPSPSGKDEPADNKSEELTEYEFLQEYTQEIKDLEKQIASVSAENAKLRAQISDQEEVCDKISMSMYDSSSIQQSSECWCIHCLVVVHIPCSKYCEGYNLCFSWFGR
jgi:polyhydroxyalkanoate synthesis regulator phasin